MESSILARHERDNNVSDASCLDQANGPSLSASAATGSGNGVILSSAARLYRIDEVQIRASVIEV